MAFLETRVPPPVVFGAAAALMLGLARIVPGWTFDLSGVDALAVGLALLGGASGVAGVLAFRRASTTVDPTRPDTASSLVVSGIYRWTRNPMYLGLALLLVAWALRLANAATLVGPLLFCMWMTRFQIRPEERALQEKFGEAWEAYRRRTRRWI